MREMICDDSKSSSASELIEGVQNTHNAPAGEGSGKHLPKNSKTAALSVKLKGFYLTSEPCKHA